MFLTCCAPRSSKAKSSLSRTCSRTTRDHIAEVDPDPESDAVILGRRRVSVSHPSLHFDTAADGIHNTCKFRQEAVAGVLYDAAPVLGDFGVDQFPEVRFQPFVCPLLIRAHQP